MNYLYDPKEQERVMKAREGFSGRLLTNAQFDEGMAITGILEREILTSGAYKEKLGDYAYAFARTENFDATRAETILRDLFKARTGQSMNQMREELAKREEKLTPQQKASAYDYATGVGTMIKEGTKISFNRAFAHQAQELAADLNITDAGAKRLMKEEFKAAEQRELYDWGKEIEEQFYRPQIEAEKRQAEERSREKETRDSEQRSNGASRSRRGDNQNGAARSNDRRRSQPGPRP